MAKSFDYLVTLRSVAGGAFAGEPGNTSYLRIPAGVDEPAPAHGLADKQSWFREIVSAFPEDKPNETRRGGLLVFIHGYNNTADCALRRQRQLAKNLRARGWKGLVIAFDWPAEGETIKYLEDRGDASATAMRLVGELILPFIEFRRENCEINISVLAHSMGAFVLREAFLQADDHRRIASENWMIGQLVLAGADVSSSCFEPHTKESASFQRHAARLTNYFTPQDSALKVSNVKRLGLAPRVGRVGLPHNTPPKFVDVDCSERFLQLNRDKWEAAGGFGNFSHSWYFVDPVFGADLALTLAGDIDRNYFPGRRWKEDNDLVMLPRAVGAKGGRTGG